MSFFIAGAIVVTSVATGMQQKKAAKKAQKQAANDALAADKQARKAEIFAETEGLGQGSMGKVSLEVDPTLDEEDLTGNLRI